MKSSERFEGAATRLIETAAFTFEQECSEGGHSILAASDHIEDAGVFLAECFKLLDRLINLGLLR